MRSKLSLCILVSALVMALSMGAWAANLYVDAARPNDAGGGTSWGTAKKTIAAALTAAAPNDVIWAKAGIYAEGNLVMTVGGVELYGGFAGTEVPGTFDLADRNFTANETTIDASGFGHGIIIAQPASTAVVVYVVDGLTIQDADCSVTPAPVPDLGVSVPESNNGTFATRGGGFMTYAQPVVGDTRGGVVPAGSLVPTIIVRNCTVENCKATLGGGSQFDRALYVIENCSVSDCTASAVAGGGFAIVPIDQGTATVSNCTFTNNTSAGGWGAGGGSWVFWSPANYEGCKFLNNVALAATGGGVGCTLQTNGGSTYTVNLTNCLFDGNTAPTGAGLTASDFAAGPANVTNCTFVNNVSNDPVTPAASAILSLAGSPVTVINTIFADNVGGNAMESTEASTLTNCLFKSATAKYGLNITSAGEVNGDPLFVSATDFNLLWGSPAINGGLVAGAPLTDIQGRSRGSQPDIGAYEATPTPTPKVIFVNVAAATGGNGTTWALAFKTIEDAFTSAWMGDSIWVKKGTYAEGNLVMTVGGVKLYGGLAGTEAGSIYLVPTRNFATNATVINAAGFGHGIIIAQPASKIQTNYVVDGLTITGGDAIANTDPVPHMSGVPEANDDATFASRGGGLMTYAQPVIGDTRGGVVPAGSLVPTIAIRNVTVDSCNGSVGGGAMLDRALYTIENCTVTNNTCSTSGAGFAVVPIDQGVATLRNCTFTGNTSAGGWGGGGGSWAFWSPVNYEACKFFNNTSTLVNGGGLDCTLQTNGGSTYTVNVTNSLFTGNTAPNGAAVSCGNFAGGPLNVTNCTFSDNVAATAGSAILTLAASPLTAINNIVANGTGGNAIEATEASTAAHCLFFGNTAKYSATVTSTFEVTTDPLFVSATNFHLQAASLAINVGQVAGAPTTDITGVTRDATPDIGAYEYLTPLNIIYVDGSIGTAGDGLTWATAKKTIQTGLDRAALTGSIMWVAKGIYAEGNLVIPTGVTVYGGFDGTEVDTEFNLADRDFAANETTIDATGFGHGIIIAQAATTVQVTYVVDGLTIQDADAVANPAAVPDLGAGVPESQGGAASTFASRGGGFMTYSQPVVGDTRTGTVPAGSLVPTIIVRNVTVENCNASIGGASQFDRALYVIEDCTVTGNSCTVSGGGFAVVPIDQGTAYVRNCTFSGNTSAGGWGGGAGSWAFWSPVNYEGCKFLNNTAAASTGGGLGFSLQTNGGSTYTGTVINCLFAGNTAPTGGGLAGSDFTAGPLVVTNCTFSGNTSNGATPAGSAILAETGSPLTLLNTVIATGTGGNAVDATEASTADYCLFYPATAKYSATVTSTNEVTSADPKFVSVTDFHLQETSPAVEAATALGAPAVDLDGVSRTIPYDIGAYEQSSTPVAEQAAANGMWILY